MAYNPGKFALISGDKCFVMLYSTWECLENKPGAVLETNDDAAYLWRKADDFNEDDRHRDQYEDERGYEDEMEGEREFMRAEARHRDLTEDEQIIYGL